MLRYPFGLPIKIFQDPPLFFCQREHLLCLSMELSHPRRPEQPWNNLCILPFPEFLHEDPPCSAGKFLDPADHSGPGVLRSVCPLLFWLFRRLLPKTGSGIRFLPRLQIRRQDPAFLQLFLKDFIPGSKDPSGLRLAEQRPDQPALFFGHPFWGFRPSYPRFCMEPGKDRSFF